MANSLYPAFVRIEYHSDRGPHLMTIPTREYSPVSDEFTNWIDFGIDAPTMINALTDLLLPLFTNVTSIDRYTIYTMETPTSPALPVAFGDIGDTGTSVSTENHVAVQETWSFRTTEFGTFKLVLLDAPASVDFLPIRDPTGITAVENLIAELTDTTNAWSGRDNARPAQFVQIAYTLNEKLRREYRLN